MNTPTMNSFRNITTILFDLDNTLLDFNAGSRIALSNVFDKWGINNDDHSYQVFDSISNMLWAEYEAGKITQQYLFERRFYEVCKTLNISQNGTAMEEDFQRELCTSVVVIDGALETIKYLSLFFKIYIITNGNTDTQVSRIREAGIDTYIDGMFTSEQAGVQKPDLRFFELFFKKYQCSPETCVVIGDSIKADMYGAKNAGMITCLYAPDSKERKDLLYCDYVVKNIKDLIFLFENKGEL